MEQFLLLVILITIPYFCYFFVITAPLFLLHPVLNVQVYHFVVFDLVLLRLLEIIVAINYFAHRMV
jgi:hypothetical protein